MIMRGFAILGMITFCVLLSMLFAWLVIVIDDFIK
jgi:hypothetical protein